MEVTRDLLVIGGGINGAGIARDAAGRGLSVVLVEKADLASATSSSSSKLIHGGLRYLEHYEFRLVAEALAEREIMLRIAGHLTWPTRFVMPHVPELRPRWMIRTGLFLYDHLTRRSVLPGSHAVRLDRPPYASGLKPELQHGFIYSDCRVDDARLVVVNALDAARHGARVLVGVECRRASRVNGLWRAELSNGETVAAKAVVNAAGPWVKRVLNEDLGQSTRDSVRLVRRRCVSTISTSLPFGVSSNTTSELTPGPQRPSESSLVPQVIASRRGGSYSVMMPPWFTGPVYLL